jgi:hypothetical protein
MVIWSILRISGLFVAICLFLMSFDMFSPVLVHYAKKNLATMWPIAAAEDSRTG